ncbi:hypothetical protein TPA0907_53190 [Micromonospora humidisoli]|uniref:Uncharacterized protein n=1 Tax=Micromonospora humidisoli TaxID=2807622 RepID=A0ABS2JCM5_9ACTN|nr:MULTISPECIES: hypothetical protein [Micromonospora]MBM7083204.1 hypothetical protein [Micromonospora humidisoli]GHJ10952.1 hypothetical protein TPA0907_53190 [Micromonospora sp. AKA109]
MTTIGSDNLTHGPGRAERFGGKYRSVRRDTMLTEVGAGDIDFDHDGVTAPEQVGPPMSIDPNLLAEPSPARDARLTEAPESMIDHPLLRGLLLELPPKGSVPPPGWLDRWFEATRAILELLYVQGAGRSR